MTKLISSSPQILLLLSLTLVVGASPVQSQSRVSFYNNGSTLPLAMDSASEAKTCAHLYGLGYNYAHGSQWQQCYDTLKKFAELCPDFPQSWHAFNFMLSAAGTLWIKDTTYYTRYRGWLKSMLFVNKSDPEYFCACLESIAGTYQYFGDTGVVAYWREQNRGLAIAQWMLLHTSCDTGTLRMRYRDTRNTQHAEWLNDTSYYLDTTLPSMHDLGLDSLLNLYLGVGARSPLASVLASFHISSDPFTARTNLLFDLDKMVFVKAEVYDELGRMLIGDGSGHSFEPGRHQIPIDLSAYPTGAYYVRIALGDGETRTIKMIKQE